MYLKLRNVTNRNIVTFVALIIILFIFQKLLQYFFEIYHFSAKSFIRNVLLLSLCYLYYQRKPNMLYIIILTVSLFLMYLYNWNFETLSESYLGQDIVALPLTIPGYFFVHLDKLQTDTTIMKDYEDVYIPNLSPKLEDKNVWYQYNNFQIGSVTYYIIFTSISKYDSNLNLWFYYGNHDTAKTFFYNEVVQLSKFLTSKNGEEFISKCKTKSVDYKYILNLSKNTFNISFKMDNMDIKYTGVVQSKYNQFPGRIFPFSLLAFIYPAIKGKITKDDDNERFNDQLIITKGTAFVNGKLYENCTSWQDTLMGTSNYFMTTWLWIYQRSENFVIYTVWYSDPEYYNSPDTVKIIYIHDIKNNKCIINGSTFTLDKKYIQFTGINDFNIDTLGTTVQDKEFYYKYSINAPCFEANIQSIEGTSIKVCDNQYMYNRVDKTVNYENMEELMKVMEQVRYDEYCNKSTFNITYNGTVYNETATVVVDSMTWKNGWPKGYKKRNNSFFAYDSPFYINASNSNELNGKTE